MLNHSRLMTARLHKVFTADMESRRTRAENGALDWPAIILSLEHCMHRYSIKKEDFDKHIAIDVRATMHEQPSRSHRRKVLAVRLCFKKGKVYDYRFFTQRCGWKGIPLSESYTVYMNDSLREVLRQRHFNKIIRIESYETASETMRSIEWR